HIIAENTSPDFTPVLKKMKHRIFNSLFDHWDAPSDIGLLATILNPRLKSLISLPIDFEEKSQEVLKNEYNKLVATLQPEQTTHMMPAHQSRNNGSSNAFFAAIFQLPQESQSVREEVYTYMDNIVTPQATPDINPWEWWAEHKKKFPMLAIIVRKYLSIPAISVPSERLFSDAGNHYSPKRSRLSSSV
ncbi:1208_t:CDS:1, partial [Ambispora gerdemannii]